MNSFLRKNMVMLVAVFIMAAFLTAAAQGMEKQDFVITLLRGLAVGSITFLVASGFSLIFGTSSPSDQAARSMRERFHGFPLVSIA